MKIATLISILSLPLTIFAFDDYLLEGYGGENTGVGGAIIIVIIFFVFYEIYNKFLKENLEGVVELLKGVLFWLFISFLITQVIGALLGAPPSLLVLGIVFIVIYVVIYLFF